MPLILPGRTARSPGGAGAVQLRAEEAPGQPGRASRGRASQNGPAGGRAGRSGPAGPGQPEPAGRSPRHRRGERRRAAPRVDGTPGRGSG